VRLIFDAVYDFIYLAKWLHTETVAASRGVTISDDATAHARPRLKALPGGVMTPPGFSCWARSN